MRWNYSIFSNVNVYIFVVCFSGTYGSDCIYRCVCKNGAECDYIIGECICGLGWKGVGCDESKYILIFLIEKFWLYLVIIVEIVIESV